MSSYYPSLYQILTMDITDDLSHYIDNAKQFNGTILELGVGTGRTILPLAKMGYKIYAMDTNPDMIQFARSFMTKQNIENIFWTQQNMSNFQLEQTFSTIQIPLRSIHLLQTIAHVKQCLRCCQKHLNDSGSLIVHYTDNKKITVDQHWRIISERETTDGGFIWIEENVTRQENQVIVKHRFQQFDKNSACVGTWGIRHCLIDFHESLFTEDGYFMVKKRIPFSPTDTILVLQNVV